VQTGAGTALQSFSYGGTGDRLSKTDSSGTQTYTYASPLTSHRLQSVAGTSRTYDASGNTHTIGTATFTYDDRNRFTQAGGASYGYNGRGERVSKDGTADGGRRFIYGPSGQLLAEYGIRNTCVPNPKTGGCIPTPDWSPLTEYVWSDATLVGYVENAAPPLGSVFIWGPAQVYYVETDQLGTPRVVVRSDDDVVVWKWDYFASNSAFGENTPSPQTIAFNLRFPGQYYDAETGLNYNYFRDYETGTGRYVESDPIGIYGGTNTYSYVAGKPLSAVDPNGEFAFLIPVICAAGGCEAVVAAGGYCLSAMAGIAIGAGIMSAVNSQSCGDNAQCTSNDPCSGIRKQLELHKQKLLDYIANPGAHDNQGKLGQGNDEQEIQWRIQSLQKQVAMWERELAKCEAANQGKK
jgi:RHS repeat-associated protein